MAPRCYAWDNLRMPGRVTEVPEAIPTAIAVRNEIDSQNCGSRPFSNYPSGIGHRSACFFLTGPTYKD